MTVQIKDQIESFEEMWMDLESVRQSEISQKEKQILCITAYFWNPEKWYMWTYLQGRDRNADTENSYVAIDGEEGWDKLKE